jgi:hypothetical protein
MYVIIRSHVFQLEGKFLLIVLFIARIILNVIVRQMPLNVNVRYNWKPFCVCSLKVRFYL